jgi:prophage antirepressor-like protein
MEQLKTFDNSDFGTLEVITIDSKEFFPAIQCAEILGYKNPRDAIITHCRDEGVVNRDVPTDGGQQKKKYITEGNLYRLIVRSTLPAAEKFEAWIMDEVLPSIRKTGTYSLSPVNPDNTEVLNRLSHMESEYFLLKTEILEERFDKLRNEFNRTRVSDEPLEPELMVRIEDVIRWWLGLPTVMKPINPKG